MILILQAYQREYKPVSSDHCPNNNPEKVWDWTNSNLRDLIRADFVESVINLMRGYTNQSEEECREWVTQHYDEWDLMVAECMYWWTPLQPHSYLKDLKNGKLPTKLYPEDLPVEINLKKIKEDGTIEWAENFHPDHGFSHQAVKCIKKGESLDRYDYDLGCFNSSFLLHRLEKLMYSFSTICLLSK